MFDWHHFDELANHSMSATSKCHVPTCLILSFGNRTGIICLFDHKERQAPISTIRKTTLNERMKAKLKIETPLVRKEGKS